MEVVGCESTSWVIFGSAQVCANEGYIQPRIYKVHFLGSPWRQILAIKVCKRVCEYRWIFVDLSEIVQSSVAWGFSAISEITSAGSLNNALGISTVWVFLWAELMSFV